MRIAQDGGGTHHSGRDDRHAQRHRFDQYQALGFGGRGEHEDVAGAVAIEQCRAAVEIADEIHVVLHTEADAELLQTRSVRAFACDNQQKRRQLCNQPLHNLQQEADVLLHRQAADGDQRGAICGDAMLLAECRSRATSKLAQVDAGWQHGAWCGDAVTIQHVDHLLGRHDHVIDVVAQLARGAPREHPQQRFRRPRKIVGDVFLKIRVVGLDRRATAELRQAHAQLVRAERRMDVDHVPVPLRQLRQHGTQRGCTDQAILWVEENPARWQADDLIGAVSAERVLATGIAVIRRDDGDLMAHLRQRFGKCADRGRDAIDAREVHIGQHQ